MRRMLRALPWLSSVAQMALAGMVALTVVVSGYVYLNDPLELPVNGLRGEMTGRNSMRIYITGYKTHDRCPGQWQLIVDGHNGPWIVSEERRTGIVPTGAMNAIPIDVRLPRALPPGSYTATLIVEYHCLLPFRHRASFELLVP